MLKMRVSGKCRIMLQTTHVIDLNLNVSFTSERLNVNDNLLMNIALNSKCSMIFLVPTDS